LLGNRQYCYPLTVTDHASRYLLTCEALSSTREDFAFTAFERLFKERGLPANMRSDNELSRKARGRGRIDECDGLQDKQLWLDCFECRPQALIGSYEFEVFNSFTRHDERGEMKGVECSR
jgi:hypothetical protein